METLYTLMIVAFGQAKIDVFCENAFWRTDINMNMQVVELCEEDVWKLSFPDAYNQSN